MMISKQYFILIFTITSTDKAYKYDDRYTTSRRKVLAVGNFKVFTPWKIKKSMYSYKF